MKSEFRPTTAADAPAVAAFLRQIFDTDPGLPFIAPQNLHWKNWEPRADWEGSRGYAITKDGAMVGHGTVVPLSLWNGHARLRMIHLIDWAADPKSVGSGVTLMKRIAQMGDGMLVVGGSEMTVKVLPALGFQLCGVVTRFARPVRPFRRLLGQKLSVRAGAQFGRSLLWNWQARAPRTEGWTTKRIDAGQLESAAIAWPRPPEGTAIFERSAETMAYFLRCPVTPITLYSAEKGPARGYFVLAQTPAQSRIADFYVNSEVREDWRALIELAVAQSMQDPGVTEVAAMGSDPLTRQALMEAGFHARGDSEMRILTQKGVAVPAGPIRFQLLDYDGAYLHDNRASNWA